MPGYQTFPSRTSVITDAWAKPRDAAEMSTAFQGVIGALRGAWGTGPWDGGVGGNGYWCKYSMYWDAKLTFEATGLHTVTLPYRVTESVVRWWCITESGPMLNAYYVANGQTVDINFVGTVVVELQMVKVVK
jgi:hypothetical protein